MERVYQKYIYIHKILHNVLLHKMLSSLLFHYVQHSDEKEVREKCFEADSYSQRDLSKINNLVISSNKEAQQQSMRYQILMHFFELTGVQNNTINHIFLWNKLLLSLNIVRKRSYLIV